MDRLVSKRSRILQRQRRTRAVIKGTAERPRLSVFVSNKHIGAQIIDDENHRTLAYSTSISKGQESNNLNEKAAAVGVDIAQKAVKAKIKIIIFDRGAKKYHGRVKALADAARAGGLEF